MVETTHTPGHWTAFNMVHSERGGDAMTPEELGEYVKNNVIKSLEFGGSAERFLFISTGGEGDPDICHVGNGPRGPANARLIAAAPELLDALRVARAFIIVVRGDYGPILREKADRDIAMIDAAIAKATTPDTAS